MARMSAADLAHGLKGAHFPINKKDLTELARKNGAAKDVLDTMKQLPDQQFASVAEVEHAFSKSMKEHGAAQQSGSGKPTGSGQKGSH
jgi:hypothetical protein